MRPRLGLVAVVVVAGCGGGGDPDTADAVFGRDLIEVAIEMPAADWDAMRLQRKTRHAAFGSANCRDQPVYNPYTWFGATVTVDGVRLEATGVRKKGHIGSQSTLVPSLKLRFDEYVDGQTLHGLDRLALNNSKNDPSYARTCLAYAVYADAGIPAPRCTIAHVTINGEDLGAYVAVEEVHAPFLARHFANPDGNLYEATACDFLPDSVGGFEQETNEDTDASRADLLAVMDVVANASDAELVAALEPLVDVDAFRRFWATEVLLWSRDGYAGNATNYFVYADPGAGGRFRFLPWGPDAVLRPNTAGLPDSVLAYGAIANRLYAIPAERQRFYAELDALLASVWRADERAAQVARIGAVVAPIVLPAVRAGFDAAQVELASVIDGRAAAIAAARAAGDPAWTEGLRVLPCRIPAGPVSGTFSTTWGTLGADAFAAGTGTLALELDGQPIDAAQVGARAGLAPTGNFDRVLMTVDLPNGHRLAVAAGFPADQIYFERYTTVGAHPLLTPPVDMTVRELDVATTPATPLRELEVGEGEWIFDAVEVRDGAPVTGRFTGTLYVPPVQQ